MAPDAGTCEKRASVTGLETAFVDQRSDLLGRTRDPIGEPAAERENAKTDVDARAELLVIQWLDQVIVSAGIETGHEIRLG